MECTVKILKANLSVSVNTARISNLGNKNSVITMQYLFCILFKESFFPLWYRDRIHDLTFARQPFMPLSCIPSPRNSHFYKCFLKDCCSDEDKFTLIYIIFNLQIQLLCMILIIGLSLKPSVFVYF